MRPAAYLTWFGVGLLWFATHPYLGVLWDSEYYTLQALHFLHPERYAHDLFFAYGSQDQFTLFSRLYGPLIGMMGLARSNMLLTLIGQAVWFGGVAHLVRASRAYLDPFTALAGVMLIPGAAGLLFHYGEQVLTPRIYAEGMTLWAMGELWRGRRWRSAAWLIGGMMLHPLMVVPGWGMWWLWGGGSTRRRGFALLLVFAGAFMLASAGIEPFVRLNQRFDPLWWNIVRKRTTYAFIGQWGLAEWLPLMHTTVLAFWVARDQPKRLRLFTRVSLGVGYLGIVVSAVGGDWLRNVMILDAQLWRGIWLSSVLVHLAVVGRFIRVWREPGDRRHARYWWLATLFMSWVAGWHGGFFFLATPLALMAFLVEWWEEDERQTPSWWVTGIEMVVLVLMLVLLAKFVVILLHNDAMVLSLEWSFLPQMALVTGILAWTLMSRTMHGPASGWVAGVVVLMVAVAHQWDQRKDWVRYRDESPVPPADLVRLLPGGKSIYWEGDPTVPWILLHRASYFSCSQGTGSLFSRDTALHYQQLYERFRVLNAVEFLQGISYCEPVPDQSGGFPGRAGVMAVCRASPGLGALVLLHPVAGMGQTVWRAPVTFHYDRLLGAQRQSYSTRVFYVVSCPVQK